MFKTYFLTTKLNLMKKLKFTGRSFVMAFSLCLVFVFLGTSAASAQSWVGPNEAVQILKAELETLENAAEVATTTEAKINIAFRHKYYRTVMDDITLFGSEVPQAVNSNRPKSKPTQHSSGLIAFSDQGDNFKQEAQQLVDDATALLTN